MAQQWRFWGLQNPSRPRTLPGRKGLVLICQAQGHRQFPLDVKGNLMGELFYFIFARIRPEVAHGAEAIILCGNSVAEQRWEKGGWWGLPWPGRGTEGGVLGLGPWSCHCCFSKDAPHQGALEPFPKVPGVPR